MGYEFPPELERMIHERMAAGGYHTEDEVLVDAMLALNDVERRQSELRLEIQSRITRAGTSLSQPLDREAFKLTARQRHGGNH